MADSEYKVKVVYELKDDASKGIGNIGSQLEGLAMKWLGIGAVVKGITTVLYKSVEAIGENQQAVAELSVAMQNGGYKTKEATDALVKYAGEMQKKTTFDDEAIMKAEAVYAQYGYTIPQIKQLTTATLDFASAKHIDAKSASELIARSIESGTAIRGVALSINGAQGSIERIDSTTKALSNTFGGQALGQTKTLAGAFLQVKNATNEVFEAIGRRLAPMLQEGAGIVGKFADTFRTWIENPKLAPFYDTMVSIGNIFVHLFNILKNVGVIDAITDAFKAMAGAVQWVWEKIEPVIKALEKGLAFVEKITGKAKGGRAGDISKEMNTPDATGTGDSGIDQAKVDANQKTNDVIAEQDSQAVADKQQAKMDALALNDEMNQEYWNRDQQREVDAFMAMDDNERGKVDLTKMSYDQLEVLRKKKALNSDKIDKQEMQAFKGSLDYMAQGMQSNNATIFAIGKATATANATISAYEAFNKALTTWPFPLNIAFAGATLAVGLDQVSRIASTQMQLAEGGTFTADQATPFNIGGQSGVFGEAGSESVQFQPLDQGGGGNISVNIDSRPLAKHLYEVQKSMERTGEIDSSR